jgi:hypothetical protein
MVRRKIEDNGGGRWCADLAVTIRALMRECFPKWMRSS